MNQRIIAFYLPQYHPIPENDEWWGPGFTEWTNVAKAKPLFKGHVQPRIPGELGFYDLRLMETRQRQAELASKASIEGFCYYHYWFGDGKQLLQRPFEEVVRSGKPNFPFCLCWANHSWESKTWTNAKKLVGSTMIMEQKYLGEGDNLNHFYALLPAFNDSRYLNVDGKPLFVIYDPFNFKNIEGFIKQWRVLAIENGLKGFHFVAIVNTLTMDMVIASKKGEGSIDTLISKRIKEVLGMGFDAVTTDNRYKAQVMSRGLLNTAWHSFLSKKMKVDRPNIFKQEDINNSWFVKDDVDENVYPTIIPNWDRTPRSKSDSIYIHSTPDVFKKMALKALELIKNKSEQHKIVFLKSWNEWGEGNYMEPDQQYGYGYIKALASACRGESLMDKK